MAAEKEWHHKLQPYLPRPTYS